MLKKIVSKKLLTICSVYLIVTHIQLHVVKICNANDFIKPLLLPNKNVSKAILSITCKSKLEDARHFSLACLVFPSCNVNEVDLK